MPDIDHIYRWADTYFNKTGLPIPYRELKIIISEIAGIPKQKVIAKNNIVISESNFRRLKYTIKKRAGGYPLQYLLGHIEFMGIDFFTGRGVFIPRPETELVVETAIKFIEQYQCKHVLDLCCGSGVIGLSIAHLKQPVKVSLTDISKKAIILSKKNCEKLGICSTVTFYRGELFSSLPRDIKFDLIVTNPPYVPHHRIAHLQKELYYEPLNALDGGSKGMKFINSIIGQAGDFLTERGMLVMEHDHTETEYIKALTMKTKGFKSLKILNDLAGFQRVSILGKS